MKYIKGKNKIIEASEKAYELIYKEQGFRSYKPKEVKPENEVLEEGGTDETKGDN
ncbi:hypothetical protein [Clostridium baratii]|uniref:hypothetical protein n=1 Tax=Clostridium baratii TaxID=1561 RepID=UPI0030CF0EE9